MMMINRRRVCGGKSLPYDYEVEYVEMINGNGVNTLQYFSNNDYIYVDGYIPNKQGRLILGGTQKKSAIGWGQYSGGMVGGLYYGKQEINVGNIFLNTRAVYEVISGKFYINGTLSKTPQSETFTTNSTVLVPEAGVGYKIYRYIHQRGNETLADYIPVVDLNGVTCFYDKISNTNFYPSGKFAAGPRVS